MEPRSTDDILEEWRGLHALMPNTAARVNAELIFRSLGIPMPRDPGNDAARTRRMYVLRPRDRGISFRIYTNNPDGRLWFEDVGVASERDFKRNFLAIVPADLPAEFVEINVYQAGHNMFRITQSGIAEIRALYLFLAAGYRCYGDGRNDYATDLTSVPIPMAGGGNVASSIGCAACGSVSIAGTCAGSCSQKYCSVQCQSKDHKSGCPKK